MIKIVSLTLSENFEGNAKIHIKIRCNSNTTDSEIMRRAGNIIRDEINRAKDDQYQIYKIKEV
ncbi:MAG: hypothetical protein PHF86_09475 [Candidatus Nanoarchaeia archaeon]|jgi:hypothetical protein|nr:hypothetical protein [Candidatus Nanoarchaeia archaeon]